LCGARPRSTDLADARIAQRDPTAGICRRTARSKIAEAGATAKGGLRKDGSMVWIQDADTGEVATQEVRGA
jgi:hypothetical protein